jgi:VIT1/CCC1 family predicted Fe2+/Mn2+ transporter
MTDTIESEGSERVLDPVDRISELMFGLFMTLTFTGTLSVATAGREDVRTMLIAAIGCNIAWGIVDAVMYVLRSLVSRGHKANILRAVQTTDSAEDAHRLIVKNMTPAGALGKQELEFIRQWIVNLPPQNPSSVHLTMRELRGAIGVFLLVFISTFPVVLPFVFLTNLHLAMRVSGAIAIAMLFLCGYKWGHYAGVSPIRVGITMVILGTLITVSVIALGG